MFPLPLSWCNFIQVNINTKKFTVTRALSVTKVSVFWYRALCCLWSAARSQVSQKF